MRKIGDLIPYTRNARRHPKEQIDQIIAAIKKYGFTVPVLIDEKNNVIAGHGRIEAAKKMGMLEIPAVVATGWSDAKKRQYVLADNKIAQNSEWDDEMLFSELNDLLSTGETINDLGFSDAELDAILGNDADNGVGAVRQIETGKAYDTFWISVRGDIQYQAEALKQIRHVMKDLPVDVEIGTVAIDG